MNDQYARLRRAYLGDSNVLSTLENIGTDVASGDYSDIVGDAELSISVGASAPAAAPVTMRAAAPAPAAGMSKTAWWLLAGAAVVIGYAAYHRSARR